VAGLPGNRRGRLVRRDGLVKASRSAQRGAELVLDAAPGLGRVGGDQAAAPGQPEGFFVSRDGIADAALLQQHVALPGQGQAGVTERRGRAGTISASVTFRSQ
jgi:hypothetical protein